jgi:hypothetical protein
MLQPGAVCISRGVLIIPELRFIKEDKKYHRARLEILKSEYPDAYPIGSPYYLPIDLYLNYYKLKEPFNV